MSNAAVCDDVPSQATPSAFTCQLKRIQQFHWRNVQLVEITKIDETLTHLKEIKEIQRKHHSTGKSYTRPKHTVCNLMAAAQRYVGHVLFLPLGCVELEKLHWTNTKLIFCI